ncbi:MAG: SDR family oxidoreductase [Epsilonproteobacteria bacterium]|nr:SDR family oxidoreductase [Campylobacterota bacterium]
MKQSAVLIVGIGSDIGRELAIRYLREGRRVVGTYRSASSLQGLPLSDGNLSLFQLELGSVVSASEFIKEFEKLDLRWDIFISCPATPLPMENFFDTDFSLWRDSVDINSTQQLRLLHMMHAFRDKTKICDVFFFGTAGINSEVVKFSAVAAGKIMLLKMCEYLDAENEDMKFMLIGPGWVKTKVHDLILKHSDPSGEKHRTTKEFMERSEGTSMDDIYECFCWLSAQEKALVGGRNFSVVHDPWRNEELLLPKLREDKGLYKLKRYGNDWHK